MTFIRFDIDHDKITLDDHIINRPSYLSVSQWLSFWSQSSTEEVQQKIDQAYQNGIEENENEHEKYIENIKSSFISDLKSLRKVVNSSFENYELNDEQKLLRILEKIDDIDGEIWRW